MNILNQAAKSPKVVSKEALETLKGIAQSIREHSTMTPWERANSAMKGALHHARTLSKDKNDFLKKAKKETGILRNSHPLLVWCVQNWY